MTRILRFAGVGLASTFCYFAVALFLTRLFPGRTVEASFAAYTVSALLSYLGHRNVTFRSGGAHGREAPRFLLLALGGYAVAVTVPLFTVGILGWPPIVSILITCIAIPAANYLLMARTVFG